MLGGGGASNSTPQGEVNENLQDKSSHRDSSQLPANGAANHCTDEGGNNEQHLHNNNEAIPTQEQQDVEGRGKEEEGEKEQNGAQELEVGLECSEVRSYQARKEDGTSNNSVVEDSDIVNCNDSITADQVISVDNNNQLVNINKKENKSDLR